MDVPYTIPHWLSAGFVHGFLDNRLDVRNGVEAAALNPATDSEVLLLNRVHLLNQIHGADFIELLGPDSQSQDVLLAPAAGEKEHWAADGWLIRVQEPQITSPSELAPPAGLDLYGIRSADCTPVLLWSPESRLAAALHCGWRSTVGGLLPRVIRRMTELGAKAIEVAIGPGARRCCFEVGPDVVEKIEPAQRSRCLTVRNNKIMFGVDDLLVSQAEEAGVLGVDIYRFFVCSICSRRFFSHRRQKASAGRQLSFICNRRA